MCITYGAYQMSVPNRTVQLTESFLGPLQEPSIPTKSGQGSLWQQSVLRIAAELRYSCQQPLVLELLTMLSIPG